MKKEFLLSALLSTSLVLCACGGNDNNEPTPAPAPEGPTNKVDNVTGISSNLMIDVETDKAVYSPGSTVKFTASEPLSGYKIRYRKGSEIISEQDGAGSAWSWTAPG